MTHLILLDLDGTLIDSFADIAVAVRQAFVDCQLTLDEELLWLLIKQGAPLEELYAATGGLDARGLEAFIARYRVHYLPAAMHSTVPYPGVADTLARLRALPDRPHLAVATAKRSDNATRILDKTGLLHLVDAVAGSEGIPAKPDPAVLHRAAGLVGLPLDGAIMVGDTVRDVHAARAARCRAWAVTYGGGTAGELAAAGAERVLGSFAELAPLLGA
jgi:phosphoglycolate phosphatase